MAMIITTAAGDTDGHFSLVFLVMAFLRFNFGMTTGKVSADGVVATLAMDVVSLRPAVMASCGSCARAGSRAVDIIGDFFLLQLLTVL